MQKPAKASGKLQPMATSLGGMTSTTPDGWDQFLNTKEFWNSAESLFVPAASGKTICCGDMNVWDVPPSKSFIRCFDDSYAILAGFRGQR